MILSRCRVVWLALGSFLCLLALSLTLLVAEPVDRAAHLYAQNKKNTRGPVVDGRYVHNVGNLQMNVTNWGFFGSLPKSRYPMADQPSAQWPAGSGIDYLYAAGIWVGAISQGIPSVSTGYPETEFYPPQDPRGDIYVSSEGALGGNRPPGPSNDDLDTLFNEDWLNGWDDDMDGRVDEDFQAIGKQMFCCFYTDDQIAAQQVFPEHTPMGIEIRQESYQWGEDGLNDFIGVRYYVTNASMNYLNGVYIGIYADVDAGPREYGSYHMDDQVGYFEGIWCVQKDDAEIPVHTYVGYVYDNDGDKGRTPGYFGIALMGYPVWIYYGTAKGYDYQWYLDPGTRGWRLSTFRIFRGLQPFEHGGEPTNDYERYDVLSSHRKDDNSISANDYKILMAVGPFFLEPGQTHNVDFAFVCGEGLEDMLDHTAAAQLVYQGCFYDDDEDPETGVIGRETMIIGPVKEFMPDPCNSSLSYDLAPKETAWANRDCREEIWKWQYSKCYTPPGIDKSRYVTGVHGREARLNWITGSAPPPPHIRLVPQDCAVTVLWDNFSETVLDPISLRNDFEGYQIWRADGWHRPYGTTTLSGPTADLWHMLALRDIVNGIAPNVDFRRPFEVGGWQYEPIPDLPDKDQIIALFEDELLQAPLDKVPCPPELSEEVCDTIEALARFNLGLDGGRQYYKFIDDGVKNGIHYFYSVIAYDHVISGGEPVSIGRFNSPASNFKYITPLSRAQEADEFEEKKVYVVPNPVTTENVEPWSLNPNNSDPTGTKCEFHNLPRCRSTVRIYTISGDLVQLLHHDGSDGNGTLKWNLLSRNGQEITSGVYLFSVDPMDGAFTRTVGKFVVIR